MNRRRQILFLGIIFGIGIAAILAGAAMCMNAKALNMATPDGPVQGSPTEQPVQGEKNRTGVFGSGLLLSTFDVSTGEPLGNVSVYFDGGFKGSTSVRGAIGILDLSPVSYGLHTIRVTKAGYLESAQRISVPFATTLKIGLQEQLLVPVHEAGSPETKIDIVFVPSGTSYNCAEQMKINSTRYVTDRAAFVTDVNRIVKESLFTLDSITDKTDPIPADYRDRFNIYYYYDSTQFADAFSGCAGTVPEKFWKNVRSADLVIILYPTYYSSDTGAPCEPNGCVSPGTGRSWMKIAADQKVLFMHESGHAVFGLIDTYCGGTKYWQNEPGANVWSSHDSCVDDVINNSWDPSACRQIEQNDPPACMKQFWRWDPDPDIMHDGYSGTFGKASTRRITYILDNINTWGETR
jgi:hypothetical protein